MRKIKKAWKEEKVKKKKKILRSQVANLLKRRPLEKKAATRQSPKEKKEKNSKWLDLERPSHQSAKQHKPSKIDDERGPTTAK